MSALARYCDTLTALQERIDALCTPVTRLTRQRGLTYRVIGEHEEVRHCWDRDLHFVAAPSLARVLVVANALVAGGWRIVWALYDSGLIVGPEGGWYRDMRWRWEAP